MALLAPPSKRGSRIYINKVAVSFQASVRIDVNQLQTLNSVELGQKVEIRRYRCIDLQTEFLQFVQYPKLRERAKIANVILRNVDVQIQVRDRSEGGYQLLHKIRQRGIIHMYPRKLLVVDFICGFWWEFEDALFPIWYVTELLVVDAAFALLGAIDARPVAVLAETEAFFTEKSAALIGRGDVIRSV